MKAKIHALLLLALLVGCHARGDEEEKHQEEHLLFVLHAKSGMLKNGKLYLQDVSDSVTYFADRPARRAGTMQLEGFLDAWDPDRYKNFEQDPPNAGFVFFEDQSKKYSDYPVELRKPQYDQQQALLSFEVRFLEGEVPKEERSLKEVNLFVDSWAGSKKAVSRSASSYNSHGVFVGSKNNR